MLKYFPRSDEPVEVCVLEGREALLAQARVLERFAQRCRQAGAMSWFAFFLDERKTRWKYPFLAVVLRAGASVSSFVEGDLLGVALYFEYRAGPLRSGAFATDDMSGFRAVIAPSALRGGVAALAIEAMVQHGAHIVLTSHETSELTDGPMPADMPPAQVASRTRVIGKYLKLHTTFAATMATLGKRTRTHMRYYQRRLIAKTACRFVPNACRVLTLEDFQQANAVSLNPVSVEDCALRYDSSCRRGSFLCGLRAADGQWLSLAGGWRQGRTTVLQWQINSAGRERDSLRTVMRTFLLEAEVARGTERLLFYGGTSHSMRHSFVQEGVRDVIVRRKSVRAWLLSLACRLVVNETGITGRANFLAEALHSRTLVWHDVQANRGIAFGGAERKEAEVAATSRASHPVSTSRG